MDESYAAVNAAVAGRQLLGAGRLSVIFADVGVDFRKVLEWGVRGEWERGGRGRR
jgi:hypothetical protein